MNTLTNKPIWNDLVKHANSLPPLKTVYQQTPNRVENFRIQGAGLTLDYAKTRVTTETIKLLLDLAHECALDTTIEQLFSGYPLNNTENRPALHTALREQDPQQIKSEVKDALSQMKNFAHAVHSGKWQGFNGEAITDVVNIGIGGSDLGPRMAAAALKHYQQKVRCHFVSNVDADELRDVLETINPASTLFIITSKTFTTQETLCNADSAKQWLQQATNDIGKHLVAVTANVEQAINWGVQQDNIFPMWDWVGGRYSLWSAVGLPIVLAVGMDNFEKLLQGAYAMDQHFRHTDFSENIPVIMALIDIWHFNFHDAKTLAILPYSHRLKLLPAYLQQLMMESNGKHVTKEGENIDYKTEAVIWGGSETDGQHAFHQLIYQGTHLIPSDFILIEKANHDWEKHQRLLVTNCQAQAQAFLEGRDTPEYYRNIKGNQPSQTILIERLTPETLGALIALYEHRTFVKSVIWAINAFDQWGVELGKAIANRILNE